MSQQQTNPEYVGMARARWPECEIEGAGGIAVVFHCCKKVVLVDFALDARQRIANKCGVQCRIDENSKWHAAYYVGESVNKTPRRSKRFPGWREDN